MVYTRFTLIVFHFFQKKENCTGVIKQKTNRNHWTSKIQIHTAKIIYHSCSMFLLNTFSCCMIWMHHSFKQSCTNRRKLFYLWNLTVWNTVSPFAICIKILCCCTPKESFTNICTFSITFRTISKWEYAWCTKGITTDG